MAKKKQKSIDWRIVVAGIFALMVIECVAMYYGINGTLRTTIIGIIALAIGVILPKPNIRG